MRYAVIYEKTRTGYSAYIPDLPGCITTGRTLDETRARMAEAVPFHIEGLQRQGLQVPEPVTVAETVEV